MRKPVLKSKTRNLKKISTEQLRQKLKLKHLKAQRNFKEKFPEIYNKLREKGIDPGKIREHSAKLIGTGILTGSLFLFPPKGLEALPQAYEIINKLKAKEDVEEKKRNENLRQVLLDTLKSLLPEKPRPLTRDEEKLLEQVFKEIIGIKTRATLESEHLNTTYGYIGAEQHLRRYPGDSLKLHGQGETIKEGIAPGLGAWGYFAPSKEKFTQDLEETEKWYAVVQTLYLPDWNTRTRYLRDWYKYRKVLIVNTQNGNAIVTAIADSGPAAWTGKHFGGSPEVMDFLGGAKYKKGAVVLFFVDDPENKVPLGPVNYDNNF